MSTNQPASSSPPGANRLPRDSLLTSGIPSPTLRETLSPEDATSQLFENRDKEYQRYVAARAMRAINESDDEKPSTGTLRQLTRQAGGQKRWKRNWAALLRAAAPAHDPELPDELQSPLPPHSRWLMDARSNVLFSVFSRSANPVEDFYLSPLDDVWRSHRYGVYGLRYRQYPNPGTMSVPRDGGGLYYRPNRKIIEDEGGALPTRRTGVVTLEHVKRVASRAVGQFFPRVHKDPTFFNSWPRIDEALGCAIEYFHHYFELRRLEETMAQLECQLYDSAQLDARRRRMEECVGELGRIYSTYLLGFGLPFHHLRQGAGYKSAAAPDRQVFEALNAFVAQCVWIVYRRPNVTVIARELGRLFRTAGFDPSRRAVPPPLDQVASTRTLMSLGQGASGTGRTASKRDRGDDSGGMSMSERRLWSSERRGALDGSMSRSSRRKQSVAPSRTNASSPGRKRRVSTVTSLSSRRQDSPAAHPGLRQANEGTSTTSHAGNVASGAAESVPKLETPSEAPGDSLLADSHLAVGDGIPSCETQSLPALSVAPMERPSLAGSGGEDPTAPSSDTPPPPPAVHVSMKKVYGLYTGAPPPQCAVYGLLRNTSPLLRQSLSRRTHEVAADKDAPLKVDRNKVGILGTPLQNYDDVLAAIDYEREEKQTQLEFLGPSSTRAGVSRVAGVVPYLLLPSRFFSPDA